MVSVSQLIEIISCTVVCVNYDFHLLPCVGEVFCSTYAQFQTIPSRMRMKAAGPQYTINETWHLCNFPATHYG